MCSIHKSSAISTNQETIFQGSFFCFKHRFYDSLSRLIEADYNDGANVYNYGYDVAGNLVDYDGVSRTYNAANQMTNDGTNTLTYDNNGNLRTVGSDTYTWDRANRLLSVGNHSYVYDGLGNRVQQTVSSVVTDYLNDLQPGLTKLLKQTTGVSVEQFVHAPRGIHAVDDGTNWHFYAQDGLGSVRAVVDDAAAVQTSMSFDPYGNPMAAYGAGFGYTGEQTDSNSQVYLRARYYTPSMGIFSALDPFEGKTCTPMSLNRYGYVHGNPVMMTDPSGECPPCFLAFLLAGVILTGCTSTNNNSNPTATSQPTVTSNPTSISTVDVSSLSSPTNISMSPTQPNFSPSEIPQSCADIIQCTATPMPTTAIPTPTEIPTNIPTPTATPPPFVNPVPGGDCTGARPGMHTSPGTRLQSRDLNAADLYAANPVVSPANNAEVVVVDPMTAEDNNAGLGNFVGIRIPDPSIPESVISGISAITRPGYLWMGFAHLRSIDVEEGDILSSGQQIGIIGNSGLVSDATDLYTNAHLHLTMFYIPAGGQLSYSQYGLAGAQLFNTVGDDSRAYPAGAALPNIVDANDIWSMPSCN